MPQTVTPPTACTAPLAAAVTQAWLACRLDPHGDVPRPLRLALLRALGPDDAVPNGPAPGIGRLRRAWLALLSAERAGLAAFADDAARHQHACTILALCQQRLAAGLPVSDVTLATAAGDLMADLADDTTSRAYLAGLAVEEAVRDTGWDRVAVECTEGLTDGEADAWDAHFWAASSLAGGTPWMSAGGARITTPQAEAVVIRHAFWAWWLTDALAAVLDRFPSPAGR